MGVILAVVPATAAVLRLHRERAPWRGEGRRGTGTKALMELAAALIPQICM